MVQKDYIGVRYNTAGYSFTLGVFGVEAVELGRHRSQTGANRSRTTGF